MTAPPTRTDWFAEVDAATTVAEVAERLGLTVRGRRIVGMRCCNSNDKRGGTTAYAQTWVCKCGAKGNTRGLVRLHLGTEDWRDVRAWFADAGWCSPDGYVSTWVAPPPRPAPPPLAYPELGDFLTLGGPVEDDPEVAAFWHARGFGARTGAAWALPERAQWPAWWPLGYKSLYRLACPMYDAQGVVRSVHARAVRDPGTWPDGKARMKTCAPKGVRGDSLLFADPWIGVPMLRGERVSCDILTIEGITDNCATTSQALPGLAILGVISGSCAAFADIVFPPGAVLFIGTDNDTQGDKYAAAIYAAVKDRIECRRVVWGIRGQDASDIVRAGVDVRVRVGAAKRMELADGVGVE